MRNAFLTVTLLLLATAAKAEEKELWFRNVERKGLAQMLRARGFECPELQAGYQVGWQSDGNHVRLVCAGLAGNNASFRMVARGSGIARMEPWETVVLAGHELRPSLE
jgi:hypothetical protein